MSNRMLLNVAIAMVTYGFSVIAAPGELSGKVTFKGTPPKRDLVKMNADPNCVKENAGKKVMKDDVIVGTGGTVANVFVYVKEGVNAASVPAAPTEPVVFDQKGCMYTPKVFGVRANQTIKILNSDPTLHNVHALPKANTGFNQGMPTKGQVTEKKFSKPEMAIKIKCDVHGWMTATANVMEHPYFAVTDEKGAFKIAGLPAGEYTVEAWHEKLGTKTQKVKVAESGTADFVYDAVAAN